MHPMEEIDLWIILFDGNIRMMLNEKTGTLPDGGMEHKGPFSRSIIASDPTRFSVCFSWVVVIF